MSSEISDECAVGALVDAEYTARRKGMQSQKPYVFGPTTEAVSSRFMAFFHVG
jgi:hypothetical protein